MNARDAIIAAMGMSSMVLSKYISDLDDNELTLRPGKGCNHVAWQLGHLISSEVSLLKSVCPNAHVELPSNFAEQHSKDAATSDDATKFCSKQQYLDLFSKVNAASQAELLKLSDADLDRPGPEHFKNMFPTVGHVFVLIATHGLMHAGQFVPLRRALGKPVLI